MREHRPGADVFLVLLAAAIIVGGYRSVTTLSDPPSRSDGSPSR